MKYPAFCPLRDLGLPVVSRTGLAERLKACVQRYDVHVDSSAWAIAMVCCPCCCSAAAYQQPNIPVLKLWRALENLGPRCLLYFVEMKVV